MTSVRQSCVPGTPGQEGRVVDLLELTKLDNHLQQEIQDAVHRGDWDYHESMLYQWREVDTALAIAQQSGVRG